jgi:hypothetical protein
MRIALQNWLLASSRLSFVADTSGAVSRSAVISIGLIAVGLLVWFNDEVGSAITQTCATAVAWMLQGFGR